MEQERQQYDYNRFTREDVLLYGEILDSLPFDPELNRFFVEQYHRENRLRYRERRYLTNESSLSRRSAPHLPSAEQEYLRAEMLGELEQALLYLSPRIRERIILRCQYGLTYAEIAEKMHCSESAAAQSVKSGIRRLRLILRAGKTCFLPQDP